MTCKAKRLKCDEKKPSCQQCHKRSVDCGGYKKDFKWRAFEEATFVSKPSSPTLKNGVYYIYVYSKTKLNSSLATLSGTSGSPASSETSQSTIRKDNRFSRPPIQYSLPSFLPIDPQLEQWPNGDFLDTFPFDQTVCLDSGLPPWGIEEGIPPIDTPTTVNSVFDDGSTQQSGFSTATSFSPGESPRLINLRIQGANLDAVPLPEYGDFQYEQGPPGHREAQYQFRDDDAERTPTAHALYKMEDNIDEVQPSDPAETWLMRLPSPSICDSSGSSEDSRFHAMCKEPSLPPGSPEMLMMRFDRQTCGILSVKDGPNENPWRTMIWPLARESPALYHAISSMTAFHTSKEMPALRVQGIDHMRQSLKLLASEIETMRTDTALATTLVLAFSESWDQHISTGIEHLRGAKVLANRALKKQQHTTLRPEDTDRLRFLCNTWVYMDVIARITSVDDDYSTDFDAALTYCGPLSPSSEIDPLMGCASTLFPLIGRVANLVRKVMRCSSNNVNIVSQATDLKVAIENWRPPCMFEAAEDPSCKVQDSLATAEAYQWATLLYLHQAVPEIPSMSAVELAKEVLLRLASIQIQSRVVIVHIYPLLAAACEVTDPEERQWVQRRWMDMVSRMSIGNLDRCWEVIKEVWDRRDADEAEKDRQRYRRTFVANRTRHKVEDEECTQGIDCSEHNGLRKRRIGSFSSSFVSPRLAKRCTDLSECIEYERTVRGRLHWVGVMKDWNWEGQSSRSCFAKVMLLTFAVLLG